MHGNLIRHRATFWPASTIRCWKEPYETAGLIWRWFGLAILHLLWDVFSTMKEKRVAWNRDSWKVNIHFRSQNLSVCCWLDRATAVLSYFFEWMTVLFVFVGENPKAAAWMIELSVFWFDLIKVPSLVYFPVCFSPTLTSANILSNVICHGPEGKHR